MNSVYNTRAISEKNKEINNFLDAAEEIVKAEQEFDKQWNEKLEEIQTTTFESVKTDMFAQFMSVAMATLEKYHNFVLYVIIMA